MTTIYRKYRPQQFSDVSDQSHIATTLQNEIIMGTLAHAYLFSGPRGVGKTTTARLLAKAINCTDRKKDSGEPCNACSSCTEINNGRHIDVIEVDAASQTGVDNVRENIIENAQFRPNKAKYKVFIIDEVHMLSTSAFNALLKTLEEPPAHVIFILATTELHKLPATVISRCQRFHFKKIAFDEMMKRLTKICKDEEISVDTEVLERIIAKSDGGLRDAESLLGQIFSLNLKKITAKDTELVLPTSNSTATAAFIEQVLESDVAKALATLHTYLEEGVSVDQFALSIIEMLRALLVIQATGDTKNYQADFNDQVLEKLTAFSKKINPGQLIIVIESAMKRRLEIKTAAVPQLPLELFVIESSLSLKGTPVIREVAKPSVVAAPAPVAPQKTAIPPAQPAEIKTEVTITAKKESVEPPPAAPRNTGEPLKTTLEQIKGKWSNVTTKIDESVRSLTFILKMCSLQSLTGSYLALTVPYSFHKQKLEENKSKKLVEQTLEEIFGEKIFITCSVAEGTPPATATTTDTSLNDVAMAFGGQVME